MCGMHVNIRPALPRLYRNRPRAHSALSEMIVKRPPDWKRRPQGKCLGLNFCPNRRRSSLITRHSGFLPGPSGILKWIWPQPRLTGPNSIICVYWIITILFPLKKKKKDQLKAVAYWLHFLLVSPLSGSPHFCRGSDFKKNWESSRANLNWKQQGARSSLSSAPACAQDIK